MRNKQSIKILHVVSDLRRGGKERQLSILVNFSGSLIENHVIGFYKNENSYTNEYNFMNLSYTKKGKFSRVAEIYKYIKRNKIQIVHSWGNSETIYSFAAAKAAGIPLLNGSIRHGIRLNKFSHRFRSVVLKGSKYILGNSRTGFEANRIKLNEKRHFVIYNGIEEKFFIKFNESERKAFNKKHNLSENDAVFISIANFVPYKDYFTILDALSSITKKINFHYIIIGRGPIYNEIKKKISELGLEDKISIYSDNPDIPNLLSISDIFIHSSLGEGCSNAILEGSAAGLIIVASDTGGTKEIINNPELLFKYKDTQDLKNKILNAIQLYKAEPHVREKIQAKTKELFSIDILKTNYYKTIELILEDYYS